MEFKKVPNRKDIPVEPKVTLQNDGGSLEEFVSFLSKKVEEECKELDYFCGEELAYGYFEEEDIVYIFLIKNKEESESKAEEKENKNIDVNKSHLFTKGLLILILLFSSFIPNGVYASSYFSGSMSEDPTTYSGLAGARFTTTTGAKTVPGYLTIVKSKVYEDVAFTLINPNRIDAQASVRLSSLPDNANEDLLTAILAYREKFNLDEIRTSTGINVTERQLNEATQLAVWLHGSSLQVEYQIDVNSIPDTAVRTLATEITTWATQQVSSVGEKTSMGNYLFPMYKPTLNPGSAKITKNGDYIEYGPYTVSGQKGGSFAYGVLGGTILDSARKELKTVGSNQQFYVRFPTSYTGSKAIRLVGNQIDYSLKHGLGRIWLDKATKPTEVNFVVGETTGTNGSIQVNAIDALTNKPVQGVSVEIWTTGPVNSITTDTKGTGKYDTPIGTYTLKYNVPEGYVKPADQQVKVEFAGDIQTINLTLSWTKAVVNFHAVDGQTLASSGDSEAFIYDSNSKAIKRIAIAGGKVTGIVLPEGDYTLVQYKTSDGYGINTGTPFRAEAGKVVDVTVTQDANVQPTTLTIDGASANDTWVYTVSTSTRVLFKMNGSNSLKLNLPQGAYSVMAQKSDGTATTAPMNFNTVLNGPTNVTLEREIGTEEVTFNIVDTIKKEPIPSVVVGLFDENHNLLTYQAADSKGKVVFKNVKKYNIHYVNILAAPDSVSGYSANGNRFLGSTRAFTLELYSQKEIKEVTDVDTLYRVPNVTYTGSSYTYPQL